MTREKPCKFETKERVATEQIRAIKKKPNTLHQKNRKDVLRISQE
jgi:hypothetical protein